MLTLLVLGLLCQAAWGSSVDGCADKDEKLGVTDTDGRACNFYDARPDECDDFDESDFSAKVLCCACGGGEKNSSPTGQTTSETRSTLPPRDTTPPPRTTPSQTTSETRSTRPPRDTTGDTTPPPRTTGTRATRTVPERSESTQTRDTPPPRQKGCFAFNEPEMDRANCDHSNARNCVGAIPGGGKKCTFTCAPGYSPPPGGADQLYMTCDSSGTWTANAKCVPTNSGTGTPPTRTTPSTTPPPCLSSGDQQIFTKRSCCTGLVRTTTQLPTTDPKYCDQSASGFGRTCSTTATVCVTPTTTSNNITEVSGDSKCGQGTWGSSNMMGCAFKNGVFAIEIWVGVGTVLLILIGGLVGIIICCVKSKKSAYPASMGVQLGNYDWKQNPEKYDKL